MWFQYPIDACGREGEAKVPHLWTHTRRYVHKIILGAVSKFLTIYTTFSAYGMANNGTTTFVNAAACVNTTKGKIPRNPPIVFDLQREK